MPFPFTSLLEMQNHRDDFIHTESTPAFMESKDWKRSPGLACPATAVLHLMQGLEHGKGRGCFLGLLLLKVSSERRGETIPPSASFSDFS